MAKEKIIVDRKYKKKKKKEYIWEIRNRTRWLRVNFQKKKKYSDLYDANMVRKKNR